jgi:hypothetical protein
VAASLQLAKHARTLYRLAETSKKLIICLSVATFDDHG